MNILHYSLGFPPYRKGGMTKYCMDLITTQLSQNHIVGLLWPGTIKKYGHELHILRRNKVKMGKSLECESYEVINPLPVPLLDGIKDPEAFMISKEREPLHDFFVELHPDVFHIHTLMGLPIEAIDEAQKLGIKVVYTSHDYYGLCPNASLFWKNEVCDGDCKKCASCCQNGLSLQKIKILQSDIYRNLKDNFLVQALRKSHMGKHSSEQSKVESSKQIEEYDVSKEDNYLCLRNYYIEMLEKIDVVHFNSRLTMQTYGRFYDSARNGICISISHGSIADNRKKVDVAETINIAYLGPCLNARKGFHILKEALDRLWDEGLHNFRLHVYTMCPVEAAYIEKHEAYVYEELPHVLEDKNLVVLPSLWHETFGFTALEALSFGVPVLVTDHVGAKDIVEDGKNGKIVSSTVNGVENALRELISNSGYLKEMNQYILSDFHVKTMEEHSTEMLEKIYN